MKLLTLVLLTLAGCAEEGECYFAVEGADCTATFCAIVGDTIEAGGGWWETDDGQVFDCIGDEGCESAGRQAELACDLVPEPS